MSGRLPPILHHAGAIARLRALAQSGTFFRTGRRVGVLSGSVVLRPPLVETRSSSTQVYDLISAELEPSKARIR